MVAKSGIIQTDLTKGELRKLSALRKSVGPDIGDKAFVEWLKRAEAGKSAPVDKNAVLIAEAIGAVIKDKKLSIPREGYLITRGRGRVIVTRADT